MNEFVSLISYESESEYCTYLQAESTAWNATTAKASASRLEHQEFDSFDVPPQLNIGAHARVMGRSLPKTIELRGKLEGLPSLSERDGFVHGLTDVPHSSKSGISKYNICQWFSNGDCRYGSRCRYAHTYPEDADFYSAYTIPPMCLSPGGVSSVGSESDSGDLKYLKDTTGKGVEYVETRPGLHVVVDGKLQFVPDVSFSDPDFNVCWDFNTEQGCTHPDCTWEHRPCSSIKGHPTKFGRICCPKYGKQNLQKEDEQFREEQILALISLGFL